MSVHGLAAKIAKAVPPCGRSTMCFADKQLGCWLSCRAGTAATAGARSCKRRDISGGVNLREAWRVARGVCVPVAGAHLNRAAARARATRIHNRDRTTVSIASACDRGAIACRNLAALHVAVRAGSLACRLLTFSSCRLTTGSRVTNAID
jgi:hypothetical protein